MKKGEEILFILSIIFIALGITGIVVGSLIQLSIDQRIGGIISGFGSLFEIVALALIIIRFVKYGFAPIPQDNIVQPKKVVTVDVKPIKETQEEKLYKQYEGLYKEGLITKEDLEKKRIELLGK